MALLSARHRPLALLALLLLACGCGNAALWARWRAERALFHARLTDARARAAGSAVTPAELAHARRAYLRVCEGWPVARWVPRAEAGDTLARDVVRVSASAAIRAAELDAALGHAAAAHRSLGDLAVATERVWPSAFEARLALAHLLDAAGDSAAAMAPWEAAARSGLVVDPDSALVCGRTFEAATRVADTRRAWGHGMAADSVWIAMTAAVDAALAHHTGDSLAPALWLRRAQTGMGRGGPAGVALAAASLARALAEPAVAPFAREVRLALGEAALAGGRPDSAVAWARAAASLSGTPDLAMAVDLEVRAWTAAGRLDSAAAALDRLADTHHLPLGVATIARYQEGLLLERTGRWELARTAFHTVIASDALNPVAFDAMERLTLHQVEAHERELVDAEARQGLDQLERTLATVRDRTVRARAYQTRARLYGWLGDEPGALEAWEALWNELPDTPEGIAAGFEAATRAAHLNDRVRALNLYRELVSRAPRPATRDSARRAAVALGADTTGMR